MLKKILNNGIHSENGESLNRRIRIANLIALIAVVVMTLYTPLYFWFGQLAGILTNGSLWLVSLLTFALLKKRRYRSAFFLFSFTGYLYFIAGTLFYGPSGNLHFYLIAMCMIVTALFNSRAVITSFLVVAIVVFFGLLAWTCNYDPFVEVPPSMERLSLSIGNVNLFLLFVIISLFIVFFKGEMQRSQQRIVEQKTIIEAKNKDITDSIHYAQRIQSALLPQREDLLSPFPGAFLYFRPKDIVSGDFYWLYQTETFRFLAVGDCTGHGVPGALMSVLGINLLTEIVEHKRLFEPAAILDALREGILYALGKDRRTGAHKDGMDIALVRIDEQAQTFTYAAANNPVYHFTPEGLQELKADRQPVGFSHEIRLFTQQVVTYQSGDRLVLFTDGYADQFGGPKNKKFRYKAFRETLEKGMISDPEQVLDEVFENWRGELEQVDDICVVGIRL